ncbi:MAG: hypothetical protein E2O57_04215 [Gammaproteobacteria bacterium]|nr:MAG: hypothetical protein E2O57_04215 [Gammaproteobacteria bacterium]
MHINQRVILIEEALITVTVFLSGCANYGKLSEGGVEMAQTPITENPSGEIYPGKFVWHDLVTSDALSAGKYGATLQVTNESSQQGVERWWSPLAVCRTWGETTALMGEVP